MKDLAYEIIKIADNLAESVSIKKYLGEKVYVINENNLDNASANLLKECEKFISLNLSTEMRFSEDDAVVDSCENVADFAVKILKSNIDDRLKIAIFKDLNIFGYMFDRRPKNYKKCIHCLNDFLDEIEKFKQSISATDLDLWNNSIYGGSDQVPFFRGYLNGIMAAL